MPSSDEIVTYFVVDNRADTLQETKPLLSGLGRDSIEVFEVEYTTRTSDILVPFGRSMMEL